MTHAKNFTNYAKWLKRVQQHKAGTVFPDYADSLDALERTKVFSFRRRLFHFSKLFYYGRGAV